LQVGDVVGVTDGLSVGDFVGEAVGDFVGETDGLSVGDFVGDFVGETDGLSVGDFVGVKVGETDGLSVGDFVGVTDGMSVGDFVGFFDGRSVGDFVGVIDGLSVGSLIGFCVPASTSASQIERHSPFKRRELNKTKRRSSLIIFFNVRVETVVLLMFADSSMSSAIALDEFHPYALIPVIGANKLRTNKEIVEEIFMLVKKLVVFFLFVLYVFVYCAFPIRFLIRFEMYATMYVSLWRKQFYLFMRHCNCTECTSILDC